MDSLCSSLERTLECDDPYLQLKPGHPLYYLPQQKADGTNPTLPSDQPIRVVQTTSADAELVTLDETPTNGNAKETAVALTGKKARLPLKTGQDLPDGPPYTRVP